MPHSDEAWNLIVHELAPALAKRLEDQGFRRPLLTSRGTSHRYNGFNALLRERPDMSPEDAAVHAIARAFADAAAERTGLDLI